MSTPKKNRVLVVDDEDALRDLLSAELKRVGYEVTSAGDGIEAIPLIQQYKFDAVLLDISMPNTGGIEVLKFIQQNSPTTKAIMLTGFADLKHAMESKQFGASDFITKPFSISDVKATLEKVLNQ